MVQEQLVDYISSQMKLGVSREAIKSALVSAGWVSGDVDDTLKKVEGSGSTMAAQATAPATATAAAATASVARPASSSTGSSGGSPQMLRVSDLVSSPFSGSSAKSTPASAASLAGKSDSITAAKFGGTIKGNSFEAAAAGGAAYAEPHEKSKATLIVEIIGTILILGLAAATYYFYSGNASLAAQVATLNSQSGSVTSQLSTLQDQLTASSTADQAQIANLMAANSDLALNLSFFAVPLGTPAATPLPVTISGSISSGKGVYALTTPRGAKIFIANSSDAAIAPELKASLGQTIQLSGTYVEGSDEMTVISVATSTAPTAAPTTTPTATTTSSSSVQ